MTAGETMLYEYSDLKRRIRELEAQLNELIAKKEGVCGRIMEVRPQCISPVLANEPSDPVADAAENLSCTYTQRIDHIAKDLSKANSKLSFIEDVIDGAKLNEIEMRYVQLRYFERMPVWKVEQKIGYSERQTRRFKETLLSKIGALI